jgi:hypothetical protein
MICSSADSAGWPLSSDVLNVRACMPRLALITQLTDARVRSELLRSKVADQGLRRARRRHGGGTLSGMATTPATHEFTELPDDQALADTVVELEAHGFSVEVVDDREAARDAVLTRIPIGPRCRRRALGGPEPNQGSDQGLARARRLSEGATLTQVITTSVWRRPWLFPPRLVEDRAGPKTRRSAPSASRSRKR